VEELDATVSVVSMSEGFKKTSVTDSGTTRGHRRATITVCHAVAVWLVGWCCVLFLGFLLSFQQV
jgi:hypothetical protein